MEIHTHVVQRSILTNLFLTRSLDAFKDTLTFYFLIELLSKLDKSTQKSTVYFLKMFAQNLPKTNDRIEAFMIIPDEFLDYPGISILHRGSLALNQ